MRVERLSDGLWRWTAPHPAWTAEADGPEGWPRDVGCVYYEPADGGVVLVDPLVPDDAPSRERFWRALDGDVERRGATVVIVVTNASHGRSAKELLHRYGGPRRCQVLAHDEAAGSSAELTGTFAGASASLPGGLRAHRLPAFAGGECVVELPGGAGLVFGDAVLGNAGGVRVCPASWVGGADGLRRLVGEIRGLLPLPFERLLPSHGEPVLAGARQALLAALAAAEGGPV